MDSSDGNSNVQPDSEQPTNWRDQADGFADAFDENPESSAVAYDTPAREWAFIR